MISRDTRDQAETLRVRFRRALTVALAFALAASLGAGGVLTAAAEPEPGDVADPAEAESEPPKKKGTGVLNFGPGEFLPVPIPISNPTIGTGLGLLIGYTTKLNQKDDVSPPSIFGIAGMYTDSESWAAGLGGKFFMLEDFLRFQFGAAYFDLSYDFYGIGEGAGDDGRSIPLTQRGTLGSVEFLFRSWRKLYVGPRARLLTVDTAFDLSGILPGDPDLPPIQAETTSNAIGLAVEWNTKDFDMTPTKGTFTGLDVDFFDESWGSDFDFESYWFAYNRYLRLERDNPRQLIAVRGTACYATDGAPFYELCSVGVRDAIRGYPGGRYRDHSSVSAQAEYRWNFSGRWGVVGFAGVAEVADEFSGLDLDPDSLIPSAGVGMRFMVAQENPINVRVDYAWGRDSSALYISVGEAF